MCARFLVASVPQRSWWTTRSRSVFPACRSLFFCSAADARKTELRPRRFGERTGNPTHSLPLSVVSHSSGTAVLWCTVHISSPRPHTFRDSLHKPPRSYCATFCDTVLTVRHRSQRPALDIFTVPSRFASTRNPKHTDISFCLALCVCRSSSPPFAYCCQVAEELSTVHQAFPSTP